MHQFVSIQVVKLLLLVFVERFPACSSEVMQEGQLVLFRDLKPWV